MVNILKEIQPLNSAKSLYLQSSITILENKILLNFQLEGDIETYILDAQKTQKRENKLWERSCFELFFANKGEECYYELNISPSSSWNLYAFSKPRENMIEYQSKEEPKVQMHSLNNSYSIDIELTLPEEIDINKLEIHIATILLTKTHHQRTFWSACSKMQKPDFHRRDCFEKYL